MQGSNKPNGRKTSANNRNTKKTENKKFELYQKVSVEQKNTNRKQNKTVKKNNANKTIRKNQNQSVENKSPLKIIPLGGLEEIGKNCTVYEYEDDMIIVDCGLAFPDDEMPGIDIVIPDLSYLVKNKSRIKGIFITHGHEDHIGAVPYLLKEINVPVYSRALTLGLIEGKLAEHNLSGQVKLIEKKPGDIVKCGKFKVEFIHVNHSIPDAVAFAITTPAGTVLQTGDFKFDATPISGDMIDIARISELGKQGVLALLSDSTNAERAGVTNSEKTVGNSFANLFKMAKHDRIIVATFSSNIHRMQQIIDEAVRCGRKVAVSGRSMVNVVDVATRLGYLSIPQGVLIDMKEINQYMPHQLVIITTGSQGEPMSALHRMAQNQHKNVTITSNDTIIISASPIPGNEKTVSNVVNGLMKLGANVIYEKMYDVHVSGHACQEELKMMLAMIKPKYFIPVHGERKQLVKHKQLAEAVGIEKKNILLTENGKVIEVSNKAIKQNGVVQSGRVLVDGYGVGDVGSIVLRDRKHLAEDGIIIVVMTIDSASGEIVSGPDIVSRGFVYVRESEELMIDVKNAVYDCIDEIERKGYTDWVAIKSRVRDDLSKFLYERTHRSPMILPIIMEV
ncbi:MAG: ribonuclease J [Acutalibacteraceae bacterium]|nr:ribonuclease J [Acutalibacteraceae bacterium]